MSNKVTKAWELSQDHVLLTRAMNSLSALLTLSTESLTPEENKAVLDAKQAILNCRRRIQNEYEKISANV